MIVSVIRHLLICLSLATLAACGGGGSEPGPTIGGGNPPPPTTPGAVTIHTDAGWVACQDGKNGTWTVLSTSNNTLTDFVCTINDANGEYGIAVAGMKGNKRIVKIIQATLNEVSYFNLDYPDVPATPTMASVTLNVLNPTQSVQVASIGKQQIVFSPLTSNSQTVTLEAGTWDVAAVELDAQRNITGNMYLQRSVSIQDGATIDIDFSQATIPSSALIDHAFNISPATNTDAKARLFLQNGTVIPLNRPGNAVWTFVDQGLGDQDRFWLWAEHRVLTASTKQYVKREQIATATARPGPGDINWDLSEIPFLEGTGLSTSRASWNAFTPPATAGHPPLRLYDIYLTQKPASGEIREWNISLSTGWLGTATAYSYDIPVFVTVANLPTDYALLSGEMTEGVVAAIMVDMSIAEAARYIATRFDVPHLVTESSNWLINFTP